MTLPDEIAAEALRIGKAAGKWCELGPVAFGLCRCAGCRAERAALAEMTKLVERAVEEEREACALLVEADPWDSPADTRAIANVIRSRSLGAKGGE